MKTLTLRLPDDLARRLERLAEETGRSPEEVAQASLAEHLAARDADYEAAAARVLEKNDELYRRLS
jgi:predicted transcriptional regulator